MSSKIVVMASKGRELRRNVYRVPDDKIEVIAHGIPDFQFVAPETLLHSHFHPRFSLELERVARFTVKANARHFGAGGKPQP